jgi:hypothetical protein
MSWRRRVSVGIGRAIAFLGAYGTLAGLGLLPLPAAALALALGFFAGQLTLAVGIALAISLLANAILAVKLYRVPWRHRRERTPGPLAYVDENDLSTIILTSADLEAWWANGLRAADQQIGPQIKAYLDSIHLTPPRPFMAMVTHSPASMKTLSVQVHGTRPEDVSDYGIVRVDKAWSAQARDPLWRTDDTWRDLLRRAWARESPVDSGVVLYQFSDGWALHFSLYRTNDERIVKGRWYRLIGGELQVRSD